VRELLLLAVAASRLVLLQARLDTLNIDDVVVQLRSVAIVVLLGDLGEALLTHVVLTFIVTIEQILHATVYHRGRSLLVVRLEVTRDLAAGATKGGRLPSLTLLQFDALLG